MNKNDTAFPVLECYEEKIVGCTDGLTKREYFAAMAMQGIISNPKAGSLTYDSTAKNAVIMAHNLIAELNKV